MNRIECEQHICDIKVNLKKMKHFIVGIKGRFGIDFSTTGLLSRAQIVSAHKCDYPCHQHI